MNILRCRKGGRLSTSYSTNSGDTFSLIAQQTVGTDTFAAQIKRANPGISEPIPAGTTILIPSNRENAKGFLASGLDVKVTADRFVTMPNFTLSKRIDAIRKATFTVPNEIQTRATLPPLTPLDCSIGYNGLSEMQGRIATPKNRESESSKSLVVNAFSECANLEKSPPPLSAFPLEFKDQNLEQIAGTICNIMGIDVFFDFDSGPRFKRVDIQQGEKVLGFFAKLAEQRNLIITDDEFGSLLFTRGDGSGAPILQIDDTGRPDVKVNTVFNDDKYYSSVTGILPTKTKKPGKQFTIDNPYYTGIVRPYTFKADNIDQGELETAVRSTASRMFAGIFGASITVPFWTDDNGDILKTNSVIRLRSPSNYLNNWGEYLIAGVTLSNTEGSETATIDAVLPSAYSGKIPESLPWAN